MTEHTNWYEPLSRATMFHYLFLSFRAKRGIYVKLHEISPLRFAAVEMTKKNVRWNDKANGY